jgi:outer membrane protein assembly factor BamE
MNKKVTLVLIACSLLLSACIKPYRPDIQQGNIINNSNLREIRYGMSKQEVLFILGTPMVIDPFNEQRWDYFYSKRNHRSNQTTQRLITALFDGDRLVKLEGDVDLSNVQNLEPSTEDKQHGGTVITKPTQREKGLFNRLGLFKKKP